MKLLDLFCGAGGAAMGYHQAGFDEIVGIDNKPQPNYPFRFIQMDVFNFYTGPWNQWNLVHASPPCQPFTCLKSVFDSTKYQNLIEQTRQYLRAIDAPYVMENVVGAPLRRDLILCAASFGLRSYRHRIFECSFPVKQPDHPPHIVRVNRRKTNRRAHWNAGGFVTVIGDIGRYVGPEAMGIDWMSGHELSQAIPPAYTKYIGQQFLQSLSPVPT